MTTTNSARFALAIAAAVVLAGAMSITAQRPKAPGPTRRPVAKAAPAPKRAPVPRIEADVPFKPGETLTYDVSWSSTLSAGTATVRVLEKRPSYNSVAYYIVAESQPGSLLSRIYTLYYKADT